jgi:O-antigen ligase
MNVESPDNPLGSGTGEGGSRGFSWRLIGAVLLLVVLIAVAAILLPSGAVMLLLMAVLALPAILYLTSKPEYILAIMLFVRLSNLDIFLPMRLIRPLSVLVVAALLAVRLDGRKLAFRDRTLVVLIVAFMLTAFHSMAFAEDLPVSMRGLEILTAIFLPIGAAMLLVDSRKYFLEFLMVLVVATMISDFLPLILPPPGDYASRSLMWGEGVLRYEGYQFEANIFAFHQIFIIPILLFFLARFDKPWIVRPLVLAALAGSVFVLMLSFSRGGFVGLLVILAVLLIVERKNRVVMTIAAVGAVILVVAAPALYWDRIISMYEAAQHVSEDYSVLVRVQTMKVAVILGLKNPVFGIGIGNFIAEASRYLPFAKAVHNAYLQIFSEMGLPGLLLVSSIFIRNIFIIRSMMSSTRNRERARLGRFLMTQQIAVTVTAMFIPIAYEFIFWIPLVIPSLANISYSEMPVDPERP